MTMFLVLVTWLLQQVCFFWVRFIHSSGVRVRVRVQFLDNAAKSHEKCEVFLTKFNSNSGGISRLDSLETATVQACID